MADRVEKREQLYGFIKLFLCIGLVCLSFCFFIASFCQSGFIETRANSFNKSNEILSYEFEFENKKFKFTEDELFKETNLTKHQSKILTSVDEKIKIVDKLLVTGFDKQEAVRYAFPETDVILNKLKKSIEKEARPEEVRVVGNSCKLEFFEGKAGRYIDRQVFYENFYNSIKENSKKISFKIKVGEYKENYDLKKCFVEKGCFSTNFSSSNESRKNNIKVALSAFDGLVLDEGEILSFNSVTGKRDEKAGYMPAKIITGGTYTLGFGGGVCQVSTTLYNACLLSGLEILEVNSHSLPVSYVEPSFDAMVNSGSSDLVIRNNTNGKIIITTSCVNDVCKFKIFGLKNQYKITRTSEKTKIISAESDITDTNYEKYGLTDMEVGEERRVSYKKDGFYSNGYLNYYDAQGNLVETKKIRSNKYNATIGVVVKREE